MKGDVILVEEQHREAARRIVPALVDRIKAKASRYIITVAGESGSGKSEIGTALKEELDTVDLKTTVLGQDDYFVLPPRSNDAKRRADPDWLGPHVEVKLDALEKNLLDAIKGEKHITKPLVDYDKNRIGEEVVDLTGINVVVAEGTYTSLLKHVDTRIFIALNRLETFEHRQKRSRGSEVGDPFIEQVLRREHMIIAGHRQLADFIITKSYEVVFVK